MKTINNIEMTWIVPKQLDDRMDAKPFQKRIQTLINKINNCGYSVEKLCDKTISSFISRGVNGAIDTPTNIRLLKSRHIRDGYIDFDSAFLPKEKDNALKKKRLENNDVLLTSSGLGTIGRAALFTGKYKCTVDNHVTIIRTTTKLNSGFLVAFLNTKYGLALSEFGTTGSTGQLELSKDRIANFYIPVPDQKVQEYIGQKVALAEQCREKADRCENEANQLISTDIGEKPSEILSKIKQEGILKNGGFTVTVEPALLRNRLDPVGYHPELLEIQKSFNGKKPKYQKLRKLVKLVTNERCRVNSSYSYYVSVLHVDNKGYLDTLAASEYYPESSGREAKVNDILVSCINPAANRIAVSDGMNGTIACSPEFAILESKGLPPHYIAFILRSDLVYRQIIHLGKGTSSSRRRIDEEELLELEVPVVSKANKIAALIRKRQQLIARAFQLIAKAKSDVESLIEGKLDTQAILSGKLKAPTWEEIEKELEGI